MIGSQETNVKLATVSDYGFRTTNFWEIAAKVNILEERLSRQVITENYGFLEYMYNSQNANGWYPILRQERNWSLGLQDI